MKQIIPGKGTEKLKFGLSKEEVIEIYGKPTEIETFEGDAEEIPVDVWHYDEEELSLTFENIGIERLSSIAVSSEDYGLNDAVKIGMDESNFSEMLDNLNLGIYEDEDMSDDEDPNQHVFFFPDSNLTLWIDQGILSEIQWGPLWDEKKEDFNWPQ